MNNSLLCFLIVRCVRRLGFPQDFNGVWHAIQHIGPSCVFLSPVGLDNGHRGIALPRSVNSYCL